jgi:hypothetical protein
MGKSKTFFPEGIHLPEYPGPGFRVKPGMTRNMNSGWSLPRADRVKSSMSAPQTSVKRDGLNEETQKGLAKDPAPDGAGD